MDRNAGDTGIVAIIPYNDGQHHMNIQGEWWIQLTQLHNGTTKSLPLIRGNHWLVKLASRRCKHHSGNGRRTTLSISICHHQSETRLFVFPGLSLYYVTDNRDPSSHGTLSMNGLLKTLLISMKRLLPMFRKSFLQRSRL